MAQGGPNARPNAAFRRSLSPPFRPPVSLLSGLHHGTYSVESSNGISRDLISKQLADDEGGNEQDVKLNTPHGRAGRRTHPPPVTMLERTEGVDSWDACSNKFLLPPSSPPPFSSVFPGRTSEADRLSIRGAIIRAAS